MRFLRPLARFWTALLGCTVLVLVLAGAARLLLPALPWAVAPSLVEATPPAGATDIRPRTTITLRFSAPMNRASAEQALRLTPATPGSFTWSPDGTMLTFQPVVALTPATTYTLSLGTEALGRWWHPLAQPVAFSFSTAPQPTVVTALPTGAGVATDTALAVSFGQPMVPPEAVGVWDDAPPAFQLEPAAPLSARWADQSTLLLRPATTLAAATHYTATLSPSLTDLRGVELGAAFRWSFRTAWPALLEQAPAPGTRWVSPQTALSVHLNAPLDLALFAQALQITPTVEGDLAATMLGATQVISFTPRGGWAYGTSYRVSLVEPPGSGLGRPPAPPWEFSVEPAPRLLAYFPGQGQALPRGEAIRLVFSTPMEETALRAGLRIEPPVAELPLAVSATEVRLRPELRPSTRYTITLAADTRDRSGEPLGSEALVSLLTAPARPTLAVAAAFDGIVTLPVQPAAVVELATTNLSALNMKLYPLDRATLLRALALRPEEWATFSPERYGQTLARNWRVPLKTPADQPTTLRLPVGLSDGAALAPGAYYLQASAPEGPRSDLLLLVSAARLSLRQGPGYTLVWATNTAGKPLAGLPVALYRNATLVARGQTNADGFWVENINSSPGDPPLVAMSEDGPPAVVRSSWVLGAPVAAAPASRSLLFTDRTEYAPGDQVELRGLTRRQRADGTLSLPAPNAPCRLELQAGGVAVGLNERCTVEEATGAISGTLLLTPTLSSGDYTLAATVGDETLALPLRVVAAPQGDFKLNVAPTSARELLLTLSRDSLRLSGAVVNWRLHLAPLKPPLPPDDFTLGPLPLAEELTLMGQASADAAGQLRLSLPLTDTLARSYSLAVSLVDNGPGLVSVQGQLADEAALVALRLPTRLVASNRRPQVELAALDSLGRPTPGARLKLDVLRVDGPTRPQQTRQIVADANGRISLELSQLSPGAYELVAAAGGPPTRARLWVYSKGFAGWRVPDGQLMVIADRDRYRVGEVASLLVVAPETAGNLLLTVERGELLSAELRPVLAGQLLTLPITPNMAPGVRVGALLSAGNLRRAGTTALSVITSTTPLTLQLEVAQPEARPGATVPITITTASDNAVLVALAPALGAEPALERFTPGAPNGSSVADLPSTVARPVAAEAQPAPALNQAPAGTFVPIATSAAATGQFTAELRLPATAGAWRLMAYATNGAERFGAVSTLLTTSLPIAYDLLTPTALRPNDRAELRLALRNDTPLTRELSINLQTTGLSLNATTPVTRTVRLGPAESTNLSWEVRPLDGASAAQLDLLITSAGQRSQLARELPISALPPAQPAAGTLIGVGDLRTSLELSGTNGFVTVAVAPGLRAALADQASSLAAIAQPSVEQSAALALIAAELAQGDRSDKNNPWQALSLKALAALDAAQNADGGWGWWPETPSRPFVSAFALEAQVALDELRRPSPKAIAYLEQVAPALDADTTAYVAYVLAQTERGNTSAARLAQGLRAQQLGADGLAYLVLALPPEQSGPMLDRLQALAVRGSPPPGEFAPSSWPAGEAGALPHGPVATTAAAAQALSARRPAAPEIAGAEIRLLTAWNVAGWPTPYDTARVATALLRRTPSLEAGPRLVSLGGNPIIDTGATLTTTQRVNVPLAGLPARPELVVKTNGSASYLLSYRTAMPLGPPAPRLSLWQELIDPTSGAALDPASLRLGQLVGLRVTAVVARPLLRADLELPLPAGFVALHTPLRTPFLAMVPVPDEALLRVQGAEMSPGVYTQLIIARASALGSYSAPAARLVLPYEPGIGASAPSGLNVTIRE